MALKSCLEFHNNSMHDADRNLSTLLASFDGSVSQLFDAVFSYLARSKPEIFSASGISLEHIVSQSLHKWRTILQQEKNSRSHPHASSPNGLLRTETPSTQPTLAGDDSNAKVSESPSCNFQPSLEGNLPSKPLNQPKLEPPIYECSDVASEEIVETSIGSAGGDAEQVETYAWSQTMEDVDVRIPVPPHVIKGRQVSVVVKDSSVYIALKTTPETILLHGALRQPVESTDSLWDLAPGRHVTLHLTKREAKWWQDSALVGVRGKVEGATEPERSFSSMPEDEQADIRRIVFDAEQKVTGQPTSDTLKMESLLRTAWNAPNSPFQGQEFDLNKVNVVPSGP